MVIMNKSDNIHEGEVQLENREHFKLLEASMAKTTQEERSIISLKNITSGQTHLWHDEKMAFTNFQSA